MTSPHPQPRVAEARRRSWRRVGLLVGLVAVVGANVYLRHVLEDAPRYLYSFLDVFYRDQLPIIQARPFWRLLLPLPELTGAWAATTLLLIYQVERVWSPAGAWYLFNSLAIVVAWGTSWVVFRSAVFSFTFAIAIGFGTQFYHAYAVTGGIASYAMAAYNMLLLCTFVQIVRGAQPVWAWRVAFAVSVALNVLGYEGWLDVLVLIWAVTPLAFLGLRRLGLSDASTRLLRMTGVLTVVGLAYVIVKVTMGFGQAPGSESDILTNYASLRLVVDDLVANLFTHTYLAVSNFLPPALVGGTAMYWLGPDALVAAQHRYHEEVAHLVPLQQMFLWRFHAGATFALLIGALVVTWRRAWTAPSPWTLALGVFLMMILLAGPTHTFVKFRPMKAMPVMTYHVTVGILGMSLALAWLATTAWRTRRRFIGVVTVVLIWGLVLYGALARPPYLAFMSAQVGLGEFLYPNPMRTLVEGLGGEYDAPRGLPAYRLAPYRPDDALGLARAALADLPAPLPPVETWVAGAGDWVRPADAGGIEVTGDDSQFGYQIMSPIVAVTPGATHLVRLRFEVLEGRVCAGVLSGDQQRWLVAPDGKSVEYSFDTGDLDAIRVVIANCYGYDAGNPRSRFRLTGGSFAVIASPGAPR